MAYLDIHGIKQAFAEHMKKYRGYSDEEAAIAVSDFPDPYGNCYLDEDYLEDCEIDGVEYEKNASHTAFWRIGINDVPMFKFYTYYCMDDIPNHKVGEYMNARKLFQVDDLDASDFPEEDTSDFDDEEEKDDDEIESDINDLLSEAEDDFSELDEYLENYEDSYSGDINEYAFREAIRQGKAEYVEEHADDFDLNDTDGYSSYIYEAEDDEIVEILMNHGAFKSVDDYEDYKFSMESANGTIINFDTDFQQEAFEKYLETYGLTKEHVIELVSSGEDYEDDDFDRDLAEDMSSLGVKVEDGEISFEDMYGEEGYGAKELLEELGWDCDFEGDSWKLETVGYYFIS